MRAFSGFFVSLFGILGWLFQSILHILTCGLVLCGLIGLLIYAKVRPELDHCREVAYDKLAQMQRQDFRMLSDTEIYDKNDQLIGLINAGHYEYVPISQISMNLQNAYIAQEDRLNDEEIYLKGFLNRNVACFVMVLRFMMTARSRRL